MLCWICGVRESPACEEHGWPPGAVLRPRSPRTASAEPSLPEIQPQSEASVLRTLIAHYDSVAERAARGDDEVDGHRSAPVARAARREAAALRRELRAIRLLGCDDPPATR